MLLSKSCVYGLRASIYLASKSEETFVSIKDVSKELDLSFHFLTKILQKLTTNEYLESYKGPNGGIKITDKGREATMLSIVIAIDGPGLLTECVLGLPGCGSEKPCPVHESWVDTRASLQTMLGEATIQEIAKEGKEKQLRLMEGGNINWE